MHSYKQLIVSVVLCLCLSTLIFGQSKISLGAEEAVQRAISHNFSIDIQTIELRRLEIAKNNRWNVFIPIINTSLSAGFTDSNSQAGEDRTVVVGYNPGPPLSPITETVSPVRQTLTNSNTIALPLTFQLIGALKLPLRSYQAGQITLEKLIQETTNTVRKSYYEILILDAQIELTQEQLDVSKLRLLETKSFFSSGLVDENTLLQTELASLGAEISLNALYNQRKSSLRNLSLLLGYESTVQLELSDDLPEIDEALVQEVLGQTSVENSFDVRSQLVLLDVYKANSMLSLSSLLPSLSVQFSYVFGLNGNLSETSIFEGDNWNYQSGNISLGVSQSITNLLPFSPAFVAYRQSRLEIEKQRRSIESIMGTLESQLVFLQENLKLLDTSLKLAQRRLTVAEQSYQFANEAYDEGLISFTDLDNAEVDLLNAKTSVLESKNDIILLVLDITLLLGSTAQK